LFLIGEHIVFDTLWSPGSTGRPSIPEPAVIEPISRGVLDRPPSRAMTTWFAIKTPLRGGVSNHEAPP
jgi:hypothetical protein